MATGPATTSRLSENAIRIETGETHEQHLHAPLPATTALVEAPVVTAVAPAPAPDYKSKIVAFVVFLEGKKMFLGQEARTAGRAGQLVLQHSTQNLGALVDEFLKK